MGDVRLSSPRLRVIREGLEDLELQTANPDLVLWDMTRARHKDWPKLEDGPFMWLTFISWAAARRTGALEPGHTFERWRDEVMDITDVSESGDDEIGRPTPPVPGLD